MTSGGKFTFDSPHSLNQYNYPRDDFSNSYIFTKKSGSLSLKYSLKYYPL